MRKWVSHSTNTCPSCAALHNQVHSQATWDEFGVEPQSHRLYCQEHCTCTMEDTNEEETGDLGAVPLRRESEEDGSAGGGDEHAAASLPTGTHSPNPLERTKTVKKTKTMPVLRSLPISERLELPPRAELLPKIESGEIDHLDFSARVFRQGPNRNSYRFRDEDLTSFAASFEGQPFLRDHDTYTIDARDGTIIESSLEGNEMRQRIRLTTRRGMLDFIEGKIDRFSIGWFYDDVLCSICNSTFFSITCPHMPGREYQTESGKKKCELIFQNPKGKETSAVNTPAVEGTGIDELQEYKLEVIGDSDRRSPRAPRVKSKQLLKGVNSMDPEDVTTESAEQRAALELQGAADTIAELRQQQAESNQILLAQCSSLLDTALAASKLPAASQKAIRKPFDALLAAGKPFKATELQEAITDKRAELAEISEGASIQGPGRITGIVTSREQFQLAVEDMFGMERDPSQANVRVHKLSGIREAYLMATGDRDFMGGYHPEFSLVTANFPNIVANVQNKMLIKAWKDYEQVYGWWQKIVTIEHFTNLNDVTWVRTGTIASLPTVAERGEYQELPVGDQKETSTWSKYGGYVPLTIEAVLRDDLRAFLRMPKEVALAGIRNISELVAAIFTTASGAGPTMTDTGALFNATAQTTKGGHANLLTTALGTDYTAWNAVAAAMFKKKMWVKDAAGYYGLGKPVGIYPKYCLVPVDLAGAAANLFIPDWKVPAQNVAAVSPKWGGIVEPLTVPEWTDTTDWAAAMDPMLVPGIMIGELFGVKPQIFSASSEVDPAMFANDESRLKVRQIVTVGVADDVPLHKSNVAGG